MTVTELAERLKRPRGTVAYHVDILRRRRAAPGRADPPRPGGRRALLRAHGAHHHVPPAHARRVGVLQRRARRGRLRAARGEATGCLRHAAPRPHPCRARRGVRRPARRPVARVHRPAARRRPRVRTAHHAVPDHPTDRRRDRGRRHATRAAPRRAVLQAVLGQRRLEPRRRRRHRSPIPGWRRRSPATRCSSPSSWSPNGCRGWCSHSPPA